MHCVANKDEVADAEAKLCDHDGNVNQGQPRGAHAQSTDVSVVHVLQQLLTHGMLIFCTVVAAVIAA